MSFTDPQQIEIVSRLKLAIELHQRSQIADAEREYCEILRRFPAQFDALQLLGTVKIQQGKFEEAADLISRALQINPGSARALSNLGHALACLDRDEEAVDSFERALRLQSEYPQARQGLATSLLKLGRYEAALTNFDWVLSRQPTHADAHTRRGVALAHLGRESEALDAFDRALGLRPGDPEILNGRGNVLRSLHRYEEALASFDAILARNPHSPGVLCNRGATLSDLHRTNEAIACFDRVLAIKPDLAEAHYNRGNALRNVGRIDDALASYDRALAVDPNYVDALLNRGSALQIVFRFEEAIASYERALAIRPDDTFTIGQSAFCHLSINDWDKAYAVKRSVDERLDADRGDVEPGILVAFGDAPATQLARTQAYVRRRFRAKSTPNAVHAQNASGKIRLGYLSSDFRQHATSFLMAELLGLHDRNRFEVVGVSFGPDDGSALRTRVLNAFDRFLDARAIGDDQVAAQMVHMGIDIAIDLNGYIGGNRMGILAHRPAPIQVSYLGYPATTGAPFIDYVIGDRFVTPFDEAEFFTERIVQLPDCYQANDSTRAIGLNGPTRAQAGLPEDGFVFCCFNNNYKITPPIFDVWMRLLGAVDKSVLWLLVGEDMAQRNLRAAACHRGIDPDRLVFAERVSPDEHLARNSLADLFLDTLPYNAHTTASEALWAGLPVITCLGTTFAGRVGASLLQAVGLPDMVTRTLEEYEGLALKLARDPLMLGTVKSRLQSNRSTHPLFDSKRFARQIEAAYQTMWERHQRGDPPESFSIQ